MLVYCRRCEDSRHCVTVERARSGMFLRAQCDTAVHDRLQGQGSGEVHHSCHCQAMLGTSRK